MPSSLPTLQIRCLWAILVRNLCVRCVREIHSHYKLIILFIPLDVACHTHAIQHHRQIKTAYILPSFTDFSLSRINVNANLYFLNGRGDYNRCSTTHTITTVSCQP